MGTQEPARSRVQGLLKELTSSSDHEARHLREWLEAFSERLTNRADEVTAQIHKLVESTEVVEQELHNTFNSFRGLSSSQFVENHVYEEDETMFVHQGTKVREQGIPSQSYENDIVPRYREAVASAWSIYEQHICKPYKRSSGPHKSRILAERWHKQLPHIIGTEDFMRDNSCGLAEDRSTGMEAFEFESDAEREGADMTAEMTNSGVLLEMEQSGSESDVSDAQVGSFEPAVSAVLNFKAMLEAALRSPYIPYNDGILSNYNSSMEQLTSTTAIATISDQVPRNISEEGHTNLQSDLNIEGLLTGHAQNSTILEKHPKAAPSFTSLAPRDTVDLQVSSDPTESSKTDSPKESGTEKEHITRSINNNIKGLPSSANSGGLFDDENEEDEFLGSQKVFTNINSWSSPTIPEGLFNDVQSPVQEEYSLSRNNGLTMSAGQPNVAMKEETKAREKDVSHSPSTPQRSPSLHPEGPSSLKSRSYGHIHDLFSFQNSSSGSVPARESLSVFRKGLFDDDDDNEDDTGDLFGSSSSVKDAQNFKEIVGNDLVEDPKGKASDGHSFSLSQEEQKFAGSRLFEDSRGDANKDFFSKPSQVGKLPINHSISLLEDVKDEVDNSISLEPSVIEFKGEYSAKNDSWSSPGEVKGGNAMTVLENVSNPKNSVLLPFDSDKESEGASNTMMTVARQYGSHLLGTEKDLNAMRELDDDGDSWSSASSIPDIRQPENMETNVFQSLPSLKRNGFHTEESQQWSGKYEGIGVHLPDQRITRESVSSSEANEILSDTSQQLAVCDKGNTEKVNLDQAEEVSDVEPCAPEEEVKNVSSEWSRAKSLLQERLNLQPFGPSLQPGTTASTSKAFVGDARGEEKDDDKLKDTVHLYHATMSRPRGSSRRRGPTSIRKMPLHRSDVDVTKVSPISSAEVEQIVAHSPEKQEQAGNPKLMKGSEVQAFVSDSVRRLVAENDKQAQMNSFDYLSNRTDALASSAPSDANRAGNYSHPKVSMAVTQISQIDDTVDFRSSEGEHFLERLASSPKQDSEESTTVKSVKTSLNSHLFGDDNDNAEVDLFGPLQGGTSTDFSNSTFLSRNQRKHLSLFDSDEENSGSESKVSLKGAQLKALTQPLQGTPSVGSMESFRKDIGSSLFDEDDDDDHFT